VHKLVIKLSEQKMHGETIKVHGNYFVPVVYSVLFPIGLLAAMNEVFFMDFVGENGILQTDQVHLTSLIVYHS